MNREHDFFEVRSEGYIPEFEDMSAAFEHCLPSRSQAVADGAWKDRGATYSSLVVVVYSLVCSLEPACGVHTPGLGLA